VRIASSVQASPDRLWQEVSDWPRPHAGSDAHPGFEGEIMFDLIFIAATVAFFLLSLAYVRGCEKLQ